jgi:cytochrome P450
MVSAKIGGHEPSLAELVRLEDPEFYRDPHPVYDRMRCEQPVYYYAPLDLFVLTRYADMREVARHPDLFSSAHVLRNGWRSAPMVFGTPPPVRHRHSEGRTS